MFCICKILLAFLAPNNMNKSLILAWPTGVLLSQTILALSLMTFWRICKSPELFFLNLNENVAPKVQHTNLYCDVTNHQHRTLNHTAIFIQRRPPHTGNSIRGCRAPRFGPINLHSGCATANTKKPLTLYCEDCFTTPCMSHKHTSCMCTTPTHTPRQRIHGSESVNNAHKSTHEDMTEAQRLECHNSNGGGRCPKKRQSLGRRDVCCSRVGKGGGGGLHVGAAAGGTADHTKLSMINGT